MENSIHELIAALNPSAGWLQTQPTSSFQLSPSAATMIPEEETDDDGRP